MKDKTQCKVVVLGATGQVGRELVRHLLSDDDFEVVALVARSSSINPFSRPLISMNELPSPDEVDLVFSALPSKVALEWEKKLAQQGYRVLSNSSAYRMDPDVPILVPGINLNPNSFSSLNDKGWLICHSNCSAAILIRALFPLIHLPLKSLNIVTMQSISGAGRCGVDASSILGNLLLDIPGEAQKIEEECLKVLSPLAPTLDLHIRAHRVPTDRGHSMSVFCHFSSVIQRSEILSKWKKYEYLDQALLLYNDEPQLTQPKDFMKHISSMKSGEVLGENLISLSSLYPKQEHSKTFSFLVCGDNLGVGAASGIIMIAKSLLRTGKKL